MFLENFRKELNSMYIQTFENAPCIAIYNDAFRPDNFVKLIEEESKESWSYMPWSTSRTGASLIASSYRSSLEMSLQPIGTETVVERLKPIQESFINDVFLPIDECIWDYRNTYDLSLQGMNGWSVLKYTNDAEYHMHHDHAPDNQRVLSLVASLGSDCDGGELEFPHFKTTIKLSAGSLVLFPSNFPYSHIAHPVTSGTKYSLVTWFV